MQAGYEARTARADDRVPGAERAPGTRGAERASGAGRAECAPGAPDTERVARAGNAQRASGVRSGGRKRRALSFPTAFTILFALTIVAVAATWFVPAGQYAKLAYVAGDDALQLTSPEGQVSELPATQEALDGLGVNIGIEQFTTGALTKPISVPGTYEQLEQQPKGVADITQAMVSGTIDGVDIMVFILVLGGLIGVVNATGAFESGLVALTKRTKGREFLLVFLVALFMVLGGTSCGLEEEAVAFYPILVPVFLALGYDSIVCVGAIFLAGSMGTTFSTINPFSVVIASNAAGVPFTDGIEWRIGGCIVGACVVIAYLYWYCRKIKANPAASYTYADREHFAQLFSVGGGEAGGAAGEASAATGGNLPADGARSGGFTLRKKAILVLFVAAFVVMVVGVMELGWWFPQMAASFLAIAIVVMLISGIPEKQAVDAFISGASSLVGVSLIIGLARGINLVLEQGLISDTLLYWSSNAVQGMQGPVFILIMMGLFFLLGFVVPSSSGLAVLAMPIMAPLADTVGIDRASVVCAYQWGQYAMLYLAPTGLVLATLTMLDMQYTKWLKFVWPMVLFVLVFGGVMLVAQVLVAGA